MCLSLCVCHVKYPSLTVIFPCFRCHCACHVSVTVCVSCVCHCVCVVCLSLCVCVMCLSLCVFHVSVTVCVSCVCHVSVTVPVMCLSLCVCSHLNITFRPYSARKIIQDRGMDLLNWSILRYQACNDSQTQVFNALHTRYTRVTLFKL